MKRRIYIGPYVHGYMQAMEEISNFEAVLEELPRIDTYSITFDYFFQCGVNDFITYKFTEDKKEINFLLKEKTRTISDKKLLAAINAIERIFKHYLPDNYYREEKYNVIKGIKYFLQDLLVASNTNSSIISHFDQVSNNFKKTKALLPLELYQPIRYLINSISQDSINLPHVTHSVNKMDIDKFNKIFRDKPFNDYKSAHGELDIIKTQKTTAFNEIQKRSENLYKRYSGLINIKKSIISTLSLTSKILDLSFGKIPGTIADQATKPLTNLLEKERRIVIYDYSPLYNEFVLNRTKPLFDKEREEKL